MNEMRELTFKQKQEALESVFKQYHLAKFKLKCLEDKNFYPKIDYSIVKESQVNYNGMINRLDHYLDKKDELEKRVNMFDMIINSLSSDSREIIINEFVEHKKGDWWLEYYSRSTYYRLKSQAMEEMLFYLNISI